MSTSNSPCAACKFLRRKCTQECVFAPYFPAEQPQRFANVHKVFGASNVAKILNELDKSHREDAVNSLAYEAEARLHDPVYGCVGLISILQHSLKQLQGNLEHAKNELATMVGPSNMMQMLQNPYLRATAGGAAAAAAAAAGGSNINMMPTTTTTAAGGPQPHLGQMMMREAHLQVEQQQAMEAQQMAAAMQVMDFEQQQQQIQQQIQQQQQPLRFDGTTGYHTEFGMSSPLLALGTTGNAYQIQQQPHQTIIGNAYQIQPVLLQQQHPHDQQTIENQQQHVERMFHDQQPSASTNDQQPTTGHGGQSC